MSPFFLQTADGFEVKRIALVTYFFHKQGLFADAVVQDHDAVLPAEVGGIHEDVGRLHYSKIGFDLCFLQITADGFAAVSVTLGELFGGLLALAIKLPKMLGVQPVASLKLLITTLTSVTLFAVSGAVFLGAF